ncbi:MAG: amidohydrolase family protein [Candidatus Bathyarchaeota archaeon]|nr:amidohydrolase family protein [Candidatus Bathyarchaeota archaeon]
MTTDSHQHFWDLSRFHYEWLKHQPKVLRRNYLPQDLLPLLKETEVQHTVVVQAHNSLEEAEWLLDLADAHEFLAGVVAWVDLTSPRISEVLAQLSKRPKLRGIRYADAEGNERWLLGEEVLHGLREVARYKLTFDVLVRPHHLKYIPTLADQVPELRMVVDHIAKPRIAPNELEPWATDIAKLADIPQIYCKVSGMVTEADWKRWTVEDLKPYVDHVLKVFGVERLMWGSDWPVCLLAANYHEVYRSVLEVTDSLSREQREKLYGLNAQRFYRLT